MEGLLKRINLKTEGSENPGGGRVTQPGKLLQHPQGFLNPLQVGRRQIPRVPVLPRGAP